MIAPDGPGAEKAESTRTAENAELTTQVRSGLRWSLLNSIVARFGNVLLGIVLARLLVPSDYGVFAIGLVVVLALQSMNELGTSVALIRWPGDPRAPARTALTISLVTSGALYVACYLLSPALAAFVNQPSATGVLRFMALGVLCSGVSTIPNALLSRSLQQGRRLIADTTGFVVNAGLTVGLAVAGFGTTALAAGTVVGNLAATVLVFALAPFAVTPGWDTALARRLLGFGLPLAWTSLLWFAIMNVDYIVVGRLLDSTQLGLYLLAFNLSSWPYNLLAASIRRVAITGFARIHGDSEAFNQAFTSSAQMLFTVVLLPSLLLGLLAEPLIRLLYGVTWVPGAGALSWLAAVGCARVLLDLCYDALVGSDRPRVLLGLQILWLVALVPCLMVATAVWGITGTGIGHAVAVFAFTVPAYLVFLRRGGLPLAPLARAMVRPGVAAGAAALAVVLLDDIVRSTAGQVLGLGALAGVIYLAIAVPPAQMVRFMHAARRKARRGALASASS